MGIRMYLQRLRKTQLYAGSEIVAVSPAVLPAVASAKEGAVAVSPAVALAKAGGKWNKK